MSDAKPPPELSMDEILAAIRGTIAAGEAPDAAPAAMVQRGGRDIRLGAGERTLEDIVCDLLRPLLRAWLDENLPQIAERLVLAEITRIANKYGPD